MNTQRALKYTMYVSITLILILSSCTDAETTSAADDIILYSTNDIEGVWIGDVTYTGVVSQPVTANKKITFGPQGTFISMEPSPVYLSISGSITVASDGKISGIITTTHKTDSVNIETTSMNWSGSVFETKTKILISMNWPWDNTAPGHGNFLVTGSIRKQ